MVDLLDRHQIPIYLGALVGGAGIGLAVPAVGGPLQAVIDPLLVVLLYATFLGIPFDRIGRALRDWRFLAAILAVNFAVAPAVAFAATRLVAHDRVLLVGALFVLLAPCVDYVIVFAGLAGGARDRLLVAAPVLMAVQAVAIPVYLWLFVGREVAASIEAVPFVRAFAVIIVVPLLLAAATQRLAAKREWAASTRRSVVDAMVPIMAVTLVVIVASQIDGVRGELSSLLRAVPVFVLFAAGMVPVGVVVGRVAGLDVAGIRSVVFSGVTRNSLVILPLVLALPADYDLAPLVVVTQTLVELVIMVVMVRLVPRVIR